MSIGNFRRHAMSHTIYTKECTQFKFQMLLFVNTACLLYNREKNDRVLKNITKFKTLINGFLKKTDIPERI